MENMKFNPVGWFEIYVQDIEKATRFYEQVFQLKLANMADPSEDADGNMKMSTFPMTMDEIPGASGALVQMEGVASGGNSTIVYFSSHDCSVEEARVTQAGGKIHKSKMSIGAYGFMSLCTDVDGNMFGIHSMT